MRTDLKIVQWLFCALVAAFTVPVVAEVQARRPNVVVFLSDDQGWGDLSSSGNTDLETPNIDSLATAGASFDRFYVCPVCSPTRAEFLTGRHHAYSGVYSTSAGGERMDLDEVTIGDLFKAEGYRTGAFGKWHNGMQYPYHPNGRGFDEFYGFCSGHWGNYFDPMFERNGRIVRGRGFCIDDFTDNAIAFMEKSVDQKKPFFAYLPYNTPHSPMQVPERFWKRFSDRPLQFKNEQQPNKEIQSHKRSALAMCENLDWNVGRVLEKLDTLGIADDTIVVWFHDNGPNGTRWNGGMKGKKGSTDEGGVRSPLYVRWPHAIKPGTKIPEITSARDLLPTLCELADISFETEKSLDGVSLKPLLIGNSEGWPDRILINHWKDKISARSQQFRLDNQGKLFDMIADPGQRKDVSKEHLDVVASLVEKVTVHREAHMAGYFVDDRPFVIAHPDSILTQLPARDAVAHGGIERSNRYPNCSYFKNWKNTDDKITFVAEVATTGKYKVVLYYAAKQAGADCTLRFNDASLRFQIAEAHDVPERGAENDRHPRAESYVKDFRPVGIGEIDLRKGKGELTLRATAIPGAEAMEFRMLTLERVSLE
ncbi:Arylsulfatase [Planctomycetes bacterium CA13]|uniref:Arylsulfatase n=1 Tax=Novipirellula herctigrandis TaxID=2527986 RepID=A0A5C5YNA4_9BACT|nr:Arylsulfatase [Planctomycetes bacterium CA13]